MEKIVETSAIATNIIKALKSAIGDKKHSLHEPIFTGNEWKYVKECIDSTYVSSVGKFVDQFEKDLVQFTGAKHAVAVINGTSALHIALKLAGVENKDEVLVPALTFVATANAITYCNAIPHFVDSEYLTLGINVEKLREYLIRNTEIIDKNCVNKNSKRIIRAIVPMHTFGHPSDIDGLKSLCGDYNLAMVEDAAEAIGSYYKGQHVGTFGALGTLSFNGNKTITTGGGGAILTNDESLALKAKHLTTTAKIPHNWEFKHDQIGYNYRMPNINAALGCAQLEQLPEKLANKRRLFDLYNLEFSKVAGVQLFQEPPDCKSNYWLQTLIIDKDKSFELESILAHTNTEQFMTRPSWTLLSKLNPFEGYPSMNLETAEDLSRRIINIPSNSRMGVISN